MSRFSIDRCIFINVTPRHWNRIRQVQFKLLENLQYTAIY